MREKIIILFAVLIAAGLGVVGTLYFTDSKEVVQTTSNHSNVTVKETNTITDAVDKIYDAVVYVESSRRERAISSGSGFIYKKDSKYGYVLTNNHVVAEADKVKITTVSGEEVEATVLGTDSYADLAVLRISADVVTNVTSIGDSTKLKIGDTVFTVGTPIDSQYMGTVTKGILSSEARTITVNSDDGVYMMEVLQTDASINPGNSGGPLVNINGEVIGITSMKLVTAEIEGMGFAIPIEVAMSSVEKLEKGEKIQRPYIGVSMFDASNTAMLYRNDMRLDDSIDEGVVLGEIEKNSPADAAGLEAGDVIIKVDDEKVTNSAHFKYILYKHEIGDEVTLTISRDGKESKKTLKLNKALEDN